MNRKALVSSLIITLLVMPLTLLLGSRLPGRWYYAVSALLILELMLPFFLSFEARRPQARELITLAVMAAIAAVSRGLFAFIPHFKPITGIIMITGIAFGPQAGFITGAVAAFASNIFFSFGPQTPWQMMGYGLCGFLAGLVFRRKQKVGQRPWSVTVVQAVFAFFTILLLVGPFLDTSMLFTGMAVLSWESLGAVLLSGLPVNLIHGTAAGLTVLLLSRPLLDTLGRLQVKYGMME